MAKITRDDVLKLAKLSKLSIAEDELQSFTAELNDIVGYVEKLQSADVGGLVPTDQVTGLENVMREDEITEYQAKPDDLVDLAPDKEKHQIKVKRVL